MKNYNCPGCFTQLQAEPVYIGGKISGMQRIKCIRCDIAYYTKCTFMSSARSNRGYYKGYSLINKEVSFEEFSRLFKLKAFV